MMDIEPFSLPLSPPLSTADGTIESRRGFLVRTEIDGVAGVGEATPLPGWTESYDACQAALCGVEKPKQALEDDVFDDTPAARHAVSLAVADAAARRAGVPLYRRLGAGERVESVPVNATVGDGSPSATAEAVAEAAAADFPAVKVKVGTRSLDADIERIEAVRQRHPDIELRVDANGAWEFETAREAVESLSALGVAVLEQPLPAEALDSHRRLRGHGIDIALDEGLLRHGVDAAIAAEAADCLVCKPMALGGVDVARSAAERARADGRDVIVTTTIDGVVARAAAVHLAASIPDVRPCGLATGGRLASDVGPDAAPVSDGTAAVPQGKGNIPPL